MNSTDLVGDISITIVACWWFFLIIMAWIIHRSVGCHRLNTFTLFLPVLLVTNGILVPFSRNINAVISHHPISDRAFARYWISVALLYGFLPVGILLANCFRRRGPQPPQQFLAFPRNTCGCWLYVLCILIISAISIIQIYHNSIQLNLVKSVTGFDSYEEYAQHRYSFAEATRGPAYFIYNKLPYSLAPLAVIIMWNWRRRSLITKILFTGVLAFALIQTGHKMPLVMILCFIIIGRYAFASQLKLSRSFCFALTFISCTVILLILPAFYLAQGEESYRSALWWSVERVCGESYRSLQLPFEVYPDYHGFLHGTSQQTIAALVGVRDFIPVATYIPKVFLGQNDTSYPPLFIGEAWADYGYYGVIAYSIICGIILQAYNVWYYNRSVHYLEDTALLLTIMISTVHLLASNLITTCSSYGLGSSAVIYVLIQLWPSQLKNRREGFPDSGLQSDSGEKRLVMG